MIHEEWRPVRGFESHYVVSNLGRVKRISASRLKNSAGRNVKAYVGDKPGTKYPTVHFNVEGRIFTKRVHVLVFEAFHGPVPPGLEINHKDGNKQNCRSENLEADTREYNHWHATYHGLNDQRGERNHQAKLDEPTARRILAVYATGLCGVIRLGKFFQVSSTTIRQIVKRKNWTHIDRLTIKKDFETAHLIRERFPADGPRQALRPDIRSKKYLRWIRSLPCVICKSEQRIEASHTGPHGLAIKSSDFTTIPLCETHHRTGSDSYHKLGPATFQAVHQLDIASLVCSLNERGPKPRFIKRAA